MTRKVVKESVHATACWRVAASVLLAGALFQCTSPPPVKNSIAPAPVDSPAVKKIQPVRATPDSEISIYLTFDDGPSPASGVLNRIAATDSVPFTMFIIGQKTLESDTARQRMRDYGSDSFIAIGNHTFTHASKRYHHYYEDKEAVVRDIELNRDTLGLQDKIVRLPGRNAWRLHGRCRTDLDDAKGPADTLAALGYALFGWDLEWPYSKDSAVISTTAETVMRKVKEMASGRKSFTKNHIVILCHEYMFTDTPNAAQLERFISEMKMQKNYRFAFLRNYPAN